MRFFLPSTHIVMAPETGDGSIDSVAASMMVPVEEEKKGKSAAAAGSAGADSTSSKPQSARPAAAENSPLDGERQDAGDGSDAEFDDDSQTNEEDDDSGDPLENLFSDEGDTTADEERDADEESDDDDNNTSLGDDRKVTVTVDGEEVDVTLGELKRRYAGEGAIEKRLQQATEARKVATQDYQKMQQLTQVMLAEMGQNLFRRVIEKPTDEFRRANPTQYLLQMDQYNREGVALQAAQSRLMQITQQVDEQMETVRQAHRQEAAKRLFEIMPVFRDKVKGPKVRDALISAAKEIGYTEQEIADCTDPLMFKTVALAARELRRMKGMKAEVVKEKTRTIKAKASKPMQSSAKRQETQALVRARKSGKIDDIALSMLQPAKRRPA